MTDIVIAGLGQTEVGEHWDVSLRELALWALEDAVRDSGGIRPEALYVGNMLAGTLSSQQHLGALIADFAGLRGIEAVTIEAAGASGGAALRQGYLAVKSGIVTSALVVGVEKVTDKIGAGVSAALASSGDSDFESAQGVTPTALAGLIMRRYMHEHGVGLKDFAGFSVNAHANAKTNSRAMYRNAISPEAYVKASMVADPINVFDTAPDADGAAAVLITTADRLPEGFEHPPVRIAASALATEALAVHDRKDPLALTAARISAQRAYAQAGIGPEDIDVFELYDSHTVMAAMSLEAAGFADRGRGWEFARDGNTSREGKIPVSTFGGLKARGNPGGATGVYQAVEIALQLRGEGGANQVPGARWGMAQCLGGSGATAVTHIFLAQE